MNYHPMIARLVGLGLMIGLIAAGSPAVFSGTGGRNPQSVQAGTGKEEIVYKPLPGPGKKCWIQEEMYFTYKFSEKPKMGTVILIVQVFDKKGDQLTPFTIKGRSDMPSMRAPTTRATRSSS